MIKNQYTNEQKEKWVKEWEQSDLPTSEFAKTIGVKSQLLYGWRSAINKRLKKEKKTESVAVLTSVKGHEVIDVEPVRRFKINYCCNCGCPVGKGVDVAINDLE